MPVALGVNGGVLGSNNLPTATTFRGIFTPNEVARAIALGFWPVNKSQSVTGVAGAGALGTLTVGTNADPYFNLTTLLLSTTATNGAQNNIFQDSSTNNFTITRNGNTTQGTFSPFSQTGWGNYFDGSGDYLTANGGTTANLGTTWTIECWLYPNNVSGTGAIVNVNINTANQGINIYRSGATITVDNGASAGTGPSGGTLVANTWQHVAVVADGTNTRIYLNGSQVGSTFAGTVTLGTPTHFWIGSSFTGLTAWAGYISNARIVKGVAVYTGAFTPPTSPLAATQSAGTNISAITGTQTSLLTCQSNRFKDNSTNNFTITPNGNTSVVPFSPFNPTSAWSASTVGGSGYFDGTGDYLSNTANNIIPSTGDFTVETWIYPTQVSTLQYLLSTTSSNTGNKFHLYINASAYVGIQTGGSYRDSSTTKIIANAWNHIACTRTGSTYAIFVNGVLQTIAGTGTMASSLDNTPTQIGSRDSGISPITGYLASTRVSNSVLYTVTFTPPTAPFTTGTNLLLNFTNSGIYDATAKNVLETVGNAQASTAISAKWGSTSMYFDGTGDYLTSLNSTLYQFGTGDFAIEGWIYINSLSAAIALIDFRAANGATFGQIYITTGGVLRFYLPTDIGTSNSFSTGAWTFFAIARTAGTLNMYIGANRGYTGTYTSAMDGGALKIGADVNGGSGLNGYLQDLRFTKGYGRGYTGATITVPTAPFSVQ